MIERLGNNNGFTLLESMMSIAIGSIALFAMTGIVYHFNNQMEQNRLIQTRDELVEMVKLYGHSVSTLKRSSQDLAVNSELSRCLSGTFCESWVENPLTLKGVGTAGNEVVAGPGNTDLGPASPKRYDRAGKPCVAGAAASESCPFEVSTTYIAQCKPPMADPTNPTLIPPDVCGAGEKPEILQIFYMVQTAPSLGLLKNSRGLLNKVEGSIVVEL